MSELKQAMKERKVQSVPSHLKPLTPAERAEFTAFQERHAPTYSVMHGGSAYDFKKQGSPKQRGVY